jgi:competence protein ComEA
MAVITPTVRPTPSPAPAVLVHVVGAVATPGVYRLPAGARVEQAITAAGGLTDEADPASINLAALLADGQQVVVKAHPASRPAADPAAVSAKGGKLNINTASAADLDQLPGIGPTLAQRIVDRRQRLGPFQSVEQLRDEKLVPTATYERIRDLVTVS